MHAVAHINRDMCLAPRPPPLPPSPSSTPTPHTHHTTTTTTRARPAKGDNSSVLPSFVLSSAVAMSGERDGASAARRRRERRLRSWWRHECQSVRMALTAATHHSAAKVVAGGQRRVAPGCLEGAGVAGWGARGAAMPGLRCAVARPRRSGRWRRWCGRLLPRLPCLSRR